MKTKVVLFIIVAVINISVALWAKIPGDKHMIILLSGVILGMWITYATMANSHEESK